MTKMGPKGGFRARLFLGLLLLAMLLMGSDTLQLSPVKALATRHLFSLEQWEIVNLPSKWLHRALDVLPGRGKDREGRLAQVREYFRLGQEVQQVEAELGRLAALRGVGDAAPSTGGAPLRGSLSNAPAQNSYEAQIQAQEQRLHELTGRREEMKAQVEEEIEAEISTTLRGEGIVYGLGPFRPFFPPVDFRLDRAPRLLVVSPRDTILLKETVLLHPHLSIEEMERLEEKVQANTSLSALVEEIGGLGAYPSIIPNIYDLRTTLILATHEWLHQYFFFRPLGQHYRASPEMATLNETAADMAGRALGDLAFQRMGGSTPPPPPAQAREQKGFDFNQEMHSTRLKVDELLSQGRIEEAERYMEERRQLFVQNRYDIRKLNQAYFAFHGSYADSPASVSPVAGELQALRRRLPSWGDFVKTVAGFGTYEQFKAHIQQSGG
ncbi:MAG: hypothetical protein HY686_04430 [Chloroflexi bacterium]|nr:hypothetical protein [Chloroflexota bacterium]